MKLTTNKTICALALSASLLTGCADKKVTLANVEYPDQTILEDVPVRTDGTAIRDENNVLLCKLYADVKDNGRYDSKDVPLEGLYYCSTLD